jgi:DNA polymerase III delta prime subunit
MAWLVDTLRGGAMLDVEFLLNPPIVLSRPLVYRYRSGLLRGQFKKALRAIAEREGELVQCTPTELPYLSISEGLFPSFAQCDWPAGRTKLSELDDVLAALTEEGRPLAVLIPENHGLFNRASWPSASRACLVVNEPTVSSATLDAILSYLVRHDAPVFAKGLLGQRPFRDYFERLVADGGCPDLPSLRQEFYRVVLLHVDPTTGAFSNEGAVADPRGTRNELLRPLRKFVGQNDPGALSDLLHGLAARFPSGRSGRELADELGRLTQNLFAVADRASRGHDARGTERPPQHSSGYRDQVATGVVLWATVLLAWTPRLSEVGSVTAGKPVADASLVEVQQLGREFTRRFTRANAADPVSGLWSPLDQVIKNVRLEGEEAETVQGVLVSVLVRGLGKPTLGELGWISRLRLILADGPAVDAAAQRARGERTDPQQPAPQKRPTCFAGVIGHQVAVDGLRRRLDQLENGTPIILCGPEGVGKRTLGRLYAKGLMCEDLGSVLPCGSCLSCREFEGRGTLDFIEFDASGAHATTYVQGRLLRDIRHATFARHRPILITNPDKAPRVVDMCLKTLETRSENIRFIFTITSPDQMSVTGQSRSDIYRLAPLDDCDARELAKRYLGVNGATADERIIDLVIGSASGLPRRLNEACAAVLAAQAATVDDVRRALKLDWTELATSYWRTLLSPDNVEDSRIALPSGWSVSEAVSRLRSILTEIRRVHLSGMVQNAAILHLENDPIGELAALLDTRAKESGRAFGDLWVALAQHWVDAETVDALGFLDIGLEARAMIDR